MSLPDPNKLLEKLQRGRLTADEEAEVQAYLAHHPEQQAIWEDELNLNLLLQQIPDVPLSSNFTGQVLQAVQNETRARSGKKAALWWSFLGSYRLPKLATLAAVVCLGLFSYHEHQQTVARREVARNL